MKTKNYMTILILAMASLGFQACGDASVSEGFTETDISTPQLAPGIQEGLCEETDQDFIFKSGINTYVRFVRGTGIVLGPDGTEYIEEEQTKSVDQSAQEGSYECTMEVSENGEEIIFTLKISRSTGTTYMFTKSTA